MTTLSYAGLPVFLPRWKSVLLGDLRLIGIPRAHASSHTHPGPATVWQNATQLCVRKGTIWLCSFRSVTYGELFILYGLISLFSFPSYLDNTVAGSIPSGMSIFESGQECMEELRGSQHRTCYQLIIRKYAHAAGSISYFFRSVR